MSEPTVHQNRSAADFSMQIQSLNENCENMFSHFNSTTKRLEESIKNNKAESDKRFSRLEQMMEELLTQTKSWSNREQVNTPEAQGSVLEQTMSNPGYAQVEREGSIEEFYTSTRSEMKPLESIKDFAHAIASSQQARGFVLTPNSVIDQVLMAKQVTYYTSVAPQTRVEKSDIARTFDKERHLSSLQYQCDYLLKSNVLNYMKLSEIDNDFHKFPPSEAIDRVFNAIASNEQIQTRTISLLSMMAVFLIYANGRINPNNIDHVKVVMMGIESLEQTIHVNDYFTLIAASESFFVDLFLEKLGWKNSLNLRNISDFTSLVKRLNSLSYTEFDPSINLIQTESEQGGAYSFSNYLDNLEDYFNSDCFNKFPLPQEHTYINNKYVCGKIDHWYLKTSETISSDAKMSSKTKKDVLKFLKMIVEQSTRSTDQALKQRDVLGRALLMLAIRDMTRDPKFEYQVVEIIRKVNACLIEDKSTIPFTQLRVIINDCLKDNNFSPSKDYTLMQQAVVTTVKDPRQVPKYLDPDLATNLTLNRVSHNKIMCKHCRILHSKFTKCIPDDKNIEAWNKFKIDEKFWKNFNTEGNTVKDFNNFFKRVCANIKKPQLSNPQNQNKRKERDTETAYRR